MPKNSWNSGWRPGKSANQVSRSSTGEVSSIRTDLDRFSDLEVNALVAHGYEVARSLNRRLGDNALKPVAFTWNMRDGGKVGIPDTGFIAQDLKAVQEQTGVTIPGLVYESNPDRLEAGYGKLLPVLVKAIQELSAEVESLKAQLKGN